MSPLRTPRPGFPDGYHDHHKARRRALIMRARRVIVLPFCVMMVAALSACGSGEGSESRAVPASQQEQSMSAIAATPAPPMAQDRPAYDADGKPAMKPQGLRADLLFAEKITSPDARFDRLEGAVTEMRRDFDSLRPAILRLAAVEEDMQILLRQLESLAAAPVPEQAQGQEQQQVTPTPVQQTPASATAPPSPITPQQAEPAQTAPAVSAPVAATPVKTTPGLAVRGLRMGLHGTETRLVLDLSGGVPAFRHDLDNGEKILVIDLPGTRWDGAREGAGPAGGIVDSWTAAPDEKNGTRVIARLRHAGAVARTAVLSAPDRVMIDLKQQ